MKVILQRKIRFCGIKDSADQTLSDSTLNLEARVSMPAIPLVGQVVSFAKYSSSTLMISGTVSEIRWLPAPKHLNTLEALIIFHEWDYREFQDHKTRETLDEVRKRLLLEFSTKVEREDLRIGEVRFSEKSC